MDNSSFPKFLILAIFLSSVASAVNVSILSQNVWFIFIASIPANDRIPGFIDEFRKGTYDILCLQEVWSGAETTYPDAFYEGLKDIYPYNVSTEPRPLTSLNLGLDSGLMILSKYPIESYDFHQYGNSSGIDGFAGKGAMTAHIKVPGDEEGQVFDLVVSNTHFNAGGPLEIRLNQAREMRSAIDSYLQKLNETKGLKIDKIPVFGAGDFNTDEWNNNLTAVQEDYAQLLAALGPSTKDLFRSLYSREADVGLTTNSSRIDYVFGLSGEYKVVGAGVDRFVQSKNPEFRLSDHMGAHATIELKPLSEDAPDSARSAASKSQRALGWWSAVSLLVTAVSLFSFHL